MLRLLCRCRFWLPAPSLHWRSCLLLRLGRHGRRLLRVLRLLLLLLRPRRWWLLSLLPRRSCLLLPCCLRLQPPPQLRGQPAQGARIPQLAHTGAQLLAISGRRQLPHKRCICGVPARTRTHTELLTEAELDVQLAG